MLTRPCDECGLDPSSVSVDDVPAFVRDNAAGWHHVLARPDVAARPSPTVWSPLEYACHVRDVFRLFDERMHLMLDEDSPHFANWDQDETAVAEHYWKQDPVTVAAELDEAAATIAASFAAIRPDQHARRGQRSDGAEFTVASFASYFVHDPHHHLTADT